MTTINQSTFGNIFGEQAWPLCEMMLLLERYAIGKKYSFMPIDTYENLVIKNPIESTYVYWREMIGRAHMAALANVCRHIKWINGCVIAKEQANYLSFAACYRGLLESAADGLDGLHLVPNNIAINAKYIVRSLKKQRQDAIPLSSELEDVLIHFSHARGKKHLPPQSPKAHYAKSAADYIRSLTQAGLQQAGDCYSELCELTHPSAMSISSLFRGTDGITWTMSPALDEALIAGLCSKYKSNSDSLLQLCINPSLLILSVINFLPIYDYRCNIVKSINMDGIAAWNTIRGNLASNGLL